MSVVVRARDEPWFACPRLHLFYMRRTQGPTNHTQNLAVETNYPPPPESGRVPEDEESDDEADDDEESGDESTRVNEGDE